MRNDRMRRMGTRAAGIVLISAALGLACACAAPNRGSDDRPAVSEAVDARKQKPTVREAPPGGKSAGEQTQGHAREAERHASQALNLGRSSPSSDATLSRYVDAAVRAASDARKSAARAADLTSRALKASSPAETRELQESAREAEDLSQTAERSARTALTAARGYLVARH